MFKYACLNAISPKGTDQFSADYQRTEDVNEADAILVRSARMHEMTLSDRTLAVARAGAGVYNIPLDAYAQKGIVGVNSPGANANSVKELVLGAMFNASRNMDRGISWTCENKDDPAISKDMEKAKKQFAGHELYGKKLGVIGLGAIGCMVANAAVDLGMDVYGYDPYLSTTAAWNISRQVRNIRDVNEIYDSCDYITIHVPLLDSTKGMVGADAISRMKKGVIFLNFARDLLVDEDAMLKAVAGGRVARYVTDFPNPKTAGREGVIATPHLGASTEEAEENCAKMAVSELQDFLENGNITHSVNYPACSMGVCKAKHRIAIYHRNIPQMISQITGILSFTNVAGMSNTSRGDFAYTLVDIDEDLKEETANRLEGIDGVIRVRVVK